MLQMRWFTDIFDSQTKALVRKDARSSYQKWVQRVSLMTFFNRFTQTSVPTQSGNIFLRYGGKGPPLLLLHGNPQTSAMWHEVADLLAKNFTVICPDLPGYGQSDKPPRTIDHLPYAKKVTGASMNQTMNTLGHSSYSIIAHDRGARVAHRMALDLPTHIQRLVLLDIVPTLEHFERTNMDFAMGYYHWFWLAQPYPIPENMINAAPENWFKGHTSREPKRDDFFHPLALKEYLSAIKNPETVSGICEDYRAAASIDLEHDRQSRADGTKISCPTMVLWGEKGKIGKWYDPLELWQPYCNQPVAGYSIPSGHYLAEEAPDQLLKGILDFFGRK